MKNLLLITAAAVGMAGSSMAAITAADAFKVGAFVLDDFRAGQSGYRGTIVVGGNLIANSNGFNGTGLQGPPLAGRNVIVAGSITSSNYNSGNFKAEAGVVYGSSPASDSYFNTPSLKLNTPADASTLKAEITQAFSDLRSLSASIAGLGGSQITYAKDVVGPFVDFAGTAGERNNYKYFSLIGGTPITDKSIMLEPFYLYTVKASEMNSMSSNGLDALLTGHVPSDLIVINIIKDLGSPSTINMNFKGPSDSTWADNIIWNVSGELTVNLNNSAFTGSLLAPESLIRQGDAEINGSLIAKSFEIIMNGGQLHPILFSGTVVPEPSTAVVGALLALGLCRRQRR